MSFHIAFNTNTGAFYGPNGFGANGFTVEAEKDAVILSDAELIVLRYTFENVGSRQVADDSSPFNTLFADCQQAVRERDQALRELASVKRVLNDYIEREYGEQA